MICTGSGGALRSRCAPRAPPPARSRAALRPTATSLATSRCAQARLHQRINAPPSHSATCPHEEAKHHGSAHHQQHNASTRPEPVKPSHFMAPSHRVAQHPATVAPGRHALGPVQARPFQCGTGSNTSKISPTQRPPDGAWRAMERSSGTSPPRIHRANYANQAHTAACHAPPHRKAQRESSCYRPATPQAPGSGHHCAATS